METADQGQACDLAILLALSMVDDPRLVMTCSI